MRTYARSANNISREPSPLGRQHVVCFAAYVLYVRLSSLSQLSTPFSNKEREPEGTME